MLKIVKNRLYIGFLLFLFPVLNQHSATDTGNNHLLPLSPAELADHINGECQPDTLSPQFSQLPRISIHRNFLGHTLLNYFLPINSMTSRTSLSLSLGSLSAMRRVSVVSASGVMRRVSSALARLRNQTKAYAPVRLLPSTKG